MIYITDGAMLDGVLDPALRALLTTRRDQLLADAAIKGFVLECRAAGGKTFYLRYQDQHGRQKQHRIAGYGDASFDKIKKEAQRLRSEVTLGGDRRGGKAIALGVRCLSEPAARSDCPAPARHRGPAV